jgi:hypothetical protein
MGTHHTCFYGQVVDEKCPKFLLLPGSPHNGLGDRLFHLSMGLVAAMDMGAVPVFRRTDWVRKASTF